MLAAAAAAATASEQQSSKVIDKASARHATPRNATQRNAAARLEVPARPFAPFQPQRAGLFLMPSFNLLQPS